MVKVFRIVLLSSVCLLASCTSMRLEDFFAGYVEQMRSVRVAQTQGDFARAISLIPHQNKSHNAYNLMLLEKGRLSFLDKNWQESQNYFDLAIQEIEHENNKAKIRISHGLQNVGAVVSNDSAIKYPIPAYEQSMLHSYQALNYLYQGSLESALVEVRRANLVQETALRENEALIYSAQNEMQQTGISTDSLYAKYPSMSEMIGDVKNGFQNAYTFYLSGLLYEAAGELNDAYIDYKKALEIFPENEYLQSDVIRLARSLHMIDELTLFEKKYPNIQPENKQSEQGVATGQLVVLYEQNIVNAKQEASVNLPVFTRQDDMRFYSFALPIYRLGQQSNQPLYLHFQQKSYQSANLVFLQSLASKQLTDQLPSLVTRQALRLIAKEQMRRKMSKEGGDVGNILAGLYNLASEKADTRSWLSLPHNIQLLKVDLPIGEQSLALEHANGTTLVDVSIKADRISLVNFTSLGNFSGYQTTNL